MKHTESLISPDHIWPDVALHLVFFMRFVYTCFGWSVIRKIPRVCFSNSRMPVNASLTYISIKLGWANALYSVRAEPMLKVNLKLYLHKINTGLIYGGIKKYSRMSLLTTRLEFLTINWTNKLSLGGCWEYYFWRLAIK